MGPAAAGAAGVACPPAAPAAASVGRRLQLASISFRAITKSVQYLKTSTAQDQNEFWVWDFSGGVAAVSFGFSVSGWSVWSFIEHSTVRERFFIELWMSDRRLEASSEGSK